jgi:hypothetical protein
MAKIELNRKWWNANRPKDVKGPELEKALAAVEQAGDDDRAAALSAVPGAVARVSKGLDKKAQKDLLKSLEMLGAMAEAEAKKAATVAAAKAKTATEAKAKAALEAKARSASEAKARDAGAAEEEEETPDAKLTDPAYLSKTIKKAVRIPLLFAFAMGSKPEGCALALHVRGNPRKLLQLATTRSGALKGCFGRAQAAEDDPRTLTLSLEGPLVSGLVRAMRKYFQLHGISQFRKIRVLVDGQEAETETAEDEMPPDAARGSASAASAPPPAASAAAPAAEPPSAPLTPKQVEVLDDRRREFKKARAAWVAVKNQAEMDLEKVKDGARTMYMADAKQFPKIDQGCKDIDSILDNLDDELRDTLDQYASTPLRNQARLQKLAATATEILDRYRTYVAGNAVMKAIDMKEFANVTIHAPVLKALNDLRKALS